MNLEQVELQPLLRSKLLAEGYETVEELKKANLIELSKELKLTKEEVSRVFEITRGGAPIQPTKTIMDILLEDKGITLSSNNLNSLFEDGVPLLRLTEICGESGSGKTQLCMQLAVNVQLPKDKGGMDGECIYIDTEGSFLSNRLYRMKNSHHNEDTILFLNKIHLFRVFNHAELTSLIRQLPDILKNTYKNVKLIIIDSMAYHFRFNCMPTQRRNLVLPYLAQSLIRIATNHKLAVVVSNHVTENGPDGAWIPALGSHWGHWCAFRLFLFRKRQFRFGYLYKNIEEEDIKPVQFCIKENGIADPEKEEVIYSQQWSNEGITEKLENAWGDLKVEKTNDIWNDTILVNDKNIFLDDLPSSESAVLRPKNEVQQSSQEETTTTNNNHKMTSNEAASISIHVNKKLNNKNAIIRNGAASSSKPLTATIDHLLSSNGRMELAESSKSTKNQPQPTEASETDDVSSERRGRKIKTSDVAEINSEKPGFNEPSFSLRNKGKKKVGIEVDVQMAMNEPLANALDQHTTRGKRKRKMDHENGLIEDQDRPSQDLNEVNGIEYSEVASPPLKSGKGRKRKMVEQPKTKKKGVQDIGLSDWSESEIEDDFNFINHFEDPF